MARFQNRIRYELNQLPSEPKQVLPIGISMPFNNPNGVFYQTYTNLDQVRTNLKNLLLTATGERYMLPEFGTNLRWLLFENISDESQFRESLIGTITSAVTTWMPYLSLSNMDVKFNLTDDGRVVELRSLVDLRTPRDTTRVVMGKMRVRLIPWRCAAAAWQEPLPGRFMPPTSTADGPKCPPCGIGAATPPVNVSAKSKRRSPSPSPNSTSTTARSS